MQYNSIQFIFFFLPIFLAVYYLMPGKLRNSVLLVGSIVFYSFAVQNSPWSLALLLGITVTAYFVGRAVSNRQVRWLFFIVICLMSVTLVFFKLYDSGKYLPVGMSFYLFQIAAYLIALFRGRIQAEKNIIRFATQILMFPKLLSGPLMDPQTLMDQTREREYHLSAFHQGLQELILGLGIKVLLANRLGGLWAQAAVVGYESISPVFAWLAIIAFAMRLYFDFHGYSLMAMGLGRMLGFTIPRNFDDPYAARSVSEFYRRWHVTLGAWFREYIYIPLGGNRKGTGRTIVNLLAVWAFTGFWHGVGGNYLLWAGILAAFIILERLWLGKYLYKSHVLSHVYTVFVILISWVPFAIGDYSQMITFLGRLFGLTGTTINPQDFVTQCKDYVWLLLAGAALATPWPRKLWERVRESWVADIFLFLLFWAAVYFVATAAQDPFMYFQF